MTQEMKVDVMVVSPHPDDAEFGVAGSVAKWIMDGKKVAYVICTNGEKGTSDYSIKPEELASIRKEEQQRATNLLGVNHLVFLDYEDQSLEDTSEFRKRIVRYIRFFKPDVLITADPYRRYIWHRDHRITGQVVIDAAFPYARDHLAYPDLLEEGLMPHKVKEMLFWGSENPNYYSDISATFEQKLEALKCHHSQVGGEQFKSIARLLRERAETAAQNHDFDLAEVFYRVVFMR